MTEATLDIKLWGNSLGVRLPASVARAARLTADQRVRITVEEGRVIITPQAPRGRWGQVLPFACVVFRPRKTPQDLVPRSDPQGSGVIVSEEAKSKT